MKYKAIIETDEYKDFEFYEDGIGKFMVGKDAGATADGGWMPLYFTECEQESCEKQEIYEKAYKEGYDKGWSDGKFIGANKWIPVSEGLPENAKHKGAFCPRYYVMTKFGQTEGWYNPDVGCWYVLLWFMDARFETWNISFERGDVPQLVKNVPVIAWMPLPEPYKAESEV